MPPKLSIVVPIYNVEDWLAECLESVRRQSVQDWEGILVVDGSTDGSERIAREYAALDDRFSVHVFENAGLGAGRNRGLRIARGEYVLFLDSDDYLTPDGVAEMVASLDRTGSDYATSVGIDVFPDREPETYWVHRMGLFKELRERVDVHDQPQLVLDHTSWNKVFRRSFLLQHSIQHPEGTLYEDVQHQVTAALAATSVDVLPIVSYCHRRRAGAISANLHGREVVTDWMTQTRTVRDRVLASGDDQVARVYFSRLIVKEMPLRVRVAATLGDRRLQTSLQEFLAELLAQSTAASAEYPQNTDVLLTNMFVDGSLERLWTLDGRATPVTAEKLPWPERIDVDLSGIAALDFKQPDERLLGRLLFDRLMSEGRTAAVWGDSALVERLAEDARALPAEVRAELAGAVTGRFGLFGIATRALADDPAGASAAAMLSPEIPAVSVLTGARDADGALVLEGETSVIPELADLLVRAEIVLRPRGADARFVQASFLGRLERVPDSRLINAVSLLEDKPEGEVQRVPVAWAVRFAAQPGEHFESMAVFLRLHHPLLGWTDSRVRIGDALAGESPDGLRVDEEWDSLDYSSPVRPSDGVRSDAAPVLDARVQDHDRASRVLVFPHWNSNPFLNILYLAARADERLDIRRAVVLPDILKGLGELGAGDIAHLHWTRTICQDAETGADARAALRSFERALSAARDRGAKLVWTVNNVLAHDARYRDVEIELNRLLADTADVVHVMAPDTVGVAAEFYAIPPERVVHIDHPSYLGVYGRRLERAEALAELGAEDHALNVLFFGQIHPYKGVDQLLGALALLEGTPQSAEEGVAADEDAPAGLPRDLGLLLAGRLKPEHSAQIESMLPERIPIVSSFEFVPDADVPLWLSASDLLVLPYRRVLNSGSLHLAATFGVSVLLPDEPHLVRQFADERWVHFYDRENAEPSMAEFLRTWTPSDLERESARAFAEERLPYRISTRIQRMLLDTVGSPVR